MIDGISTAALLEGISQSIDKLEYISDLDKVSDNITKKLENPEIQNRLELVRPEISEAPTLIENPINNGIEFNKRLVEMVHPEEIEELAKEYPQLQEKIDKLREDYKNAEGLRDLQQIEQEIKQYRGIVMEDMVEHSLIPNFEGVVLKQPSIDIGSGVTKPDVILKDAKFNFDLNDLHIEKGDNLFVEVKTGSPEYIRNEFEHILQQVEGHDGKSLVVVSKEYVDIPIEARQAFEEKLKEKGSHIFISEVDTTSLDNVLRTIVRQPN